jgi:hypothetical protein
VAAAVAVGLAVWGLTVRESDTPPRRPTGAPTQPVASPVAQIVPIGPPPWVRYPTRLEGRWVSGSAGSRLTLVVSNASVDLWQGVGQRQGHPSMHRVMIVVGQRVILRVPGDPGDVATYAWRISRDRLSFELVDKAPGATAQLAGLTFRPVD